MRQFVLYVIAAMIMFVIGVGANNTIHTLGDFVVDKLNNEGPRPDLTCDYLPRPYLVVSVANDRSLYLNRDETGTLDNTAPLNAKLRIIFEQRDFHAYRPGLELTSAVPEYQRREKTVFIKAPRWISYGEIADLIGVINDAGADGIGLVADRLPQPTIKQAKIPSSPLIPDRAPSY